MPLRQQAAPAKGVSDGPCRVLSGTTTHFENHKAHQDHKENLSLLCGPGVLRGSILCGSFNLASQLSGTGDSFSRLSGASVLRVAAHTAGGQRSFADVAETRRPGD